MSPVRKPGGESHPAKARRQAGSEVHVNHRGDLGTKLGQAVSQAAGEKYRSFPRSSVGLQPRTLCVR